MKTRAAWSVLGLAAMALAGLAVRGAVAAAEAPAYSIDPDGSWVVAVTEKAGALGFLGHRHAVLVTDWTPDVDWQPGAPASSRATFTVPTASLRIDTARGRELAGLDEGPDADDVATLQEKMLSADNPAAEAHPELRLEITGVEPRSAGKLRVAGRLTIRGHTEPVQIPVTMETAGEGAVRFTGAFTVKQTDYGIEPESIAGVVKVADPVEIRFQVVLRPAGPQRSRSTSSAPTSRPARG